MSTEFLANYPFKNNPFLHQEAYLSRFWDRDVGALFADMGTGKSPTRPAAVRGLTLLISL